MGMESQILTKQVIECCYAVHNELGIGFVEKVYENALVLALRQAGISCEKQTPINVYFRGEVVGEFYADILVNDSLILELKAVSALAGEHQAQLINYLKASGNKLGLLINFGKPGLEIRRLKNSFQ